MKSTSLLFTICMMLVVMGETLTPCHAADPMDARRTQMLKRQLQATFPASGFWYYEDRALAAYYLGQNAEGDKAMLGELAEFNKDPKLPDFHWHAFMLERIYFLFGSRGRLPHRMSAAAEKAVVEMIWKWARECCFLEMVSEDKDWMVWASENHTMQAWVSAWGAAQIFAARPEFNDKKYLDGTSMPAMAAAFNEYFKRWLRNRASRGMLVECNSSYNRYDLGPLSNLFDFATDPVLKNRARMFLDLYWADWAIEQIDGLRGGSRHRCYAGHPSLVDAGPSGEAWYLFGTGTPMDVHPSGMCFATSFYRPPTVVTDLAMNTPARGTYEYISRRPGRSVDDAPSGGQSFVANPKCAFNVKNLVYRLDPKCPDLVRYTWCTPDFVMGTSMVPALPARAWTGISSQNRWFGVIFGGHPTARIFMQPPVPPGENVSVYNDSWSVENKGVMIVQRLKTSKEAQGYHVWFDQSLTRTEKDGWVFAQAPRGYAAVRVVQGGTSWQSDMQKYRATAKMEGKGMWLELKDEFSPVILEVAQKSAYKDMAAFQKAVLGNKLSWNQEKLDYTSSGYNTTLTFWADYSHPPKVDGKSVNYTPKKAYDSPFIEGDFGSGVITIHKGEKKKVLDFNKE